MNRHEAVLVLREILGMTREINRRLTDVEHTAAARRGAEVGGPDPRHTADGP